ncbi:MAG TPA: alpha/beta hydrolase [Pseudonocardiaceae bacterium]|nr:alpha/beta hydrolase [Pseudonocardiaceae bacterium]
MTSAEAQEFAAFYEALSERFALANDKGLAIVRDVGEQMHVFGSEPEGVTYQEVDANGVRAMWAIPEGASSEHALLDFHHGGTVIASMHTERKAAGHIAKATGVRSLVVDFRRSPEHKFPAQIEDAEAAFDWVVSQGYSPAKIGTVGHSVGGYIPIRLALTLREKGKELQGAIVSVSPWIDYSMQSEDLVKKADSDKLLSVPLIEFFRECWIGGTEYTPDDPRLSLFHTDLTGLPPVQLHWGTAEVLAAEDARLGTLLGEAGVDTELHPLDEGQHSFVLAAGRVPEVDRAILNMGLWLRTKLEVK